MLPLFAPPYGLRTALGALLSDGKKFTSEKVESLYAEELGTEEAILLPSARAGILWGLQAWGAKGSRVLCPVFTCTAVWEAAYRAGAEVQGVDVGKRTFLMDEDALASGAAGEHALILSEIYGHTYNLKALRARPGNQPALRIIDLAGGVLDRGCLSRIQGSDLAVVSFGRGSKAMYCGWGGMAFTRNTELGRAVREIRDSEIRLSAPKISCERALRLLLVILLRTGTGCLLKQRGLRLFGRRRTQSVANAVSANSPESCGLPDKEFYLSCSSPEKSLMIHNLMNLREHGERRKELAKRYRQNLRDLDAVDLPMDPGDVLSHYTIRAPSEMRNRIVASLDRAGIEAGRLFFFSSAMREYRLFLSGSRYCQHEYPNAVRAAEEVINLPLFPGLTGSDVDLVSDEVRKAVSRVTKDLVPRRSVSEEALVRTSH
jgi:dTDP-4-amino-4,6-dideoxygalactose transaminase